MKKKEINKKYGIKMILEEMYVWNNNFEECTLKLVLFYYTRRNGLKNYLILEENFSEIITTHYLNTISVEEYAEKIKKLEIKENEIKVGEYGYFWNDDKKIKSFFWGKLFSIDSDFKQNIGVKSQKFINEYGLHYQHFAKTRPEWAE